MKYYLAEAQDKTFKKKSYGDNFHWTKVRAVSTHAYMHAHHHTPAAHPRQHEVAPARLGVRE